jgi:hypothetical protein
LKAPIIKAVEIDDFWEISRTFVDRSLNFYSSFFSLAKDAMSLTAVRDSSTAPPNFLTNYPFKIAAFLT